MVEMQCRDKEYESERVLQTVGMYSHRQRGETSLDDTLFDARFWLET